MPSTFGSKLATAFAERGNLCVGVDPHPALLNQWGLDDNAYGLAEFGKRVISASAGLVGIIKPQVAFFERFGSAGFKVLENLAAEAQANKLLVIMDAKRGDIGSTMNGYFDAWLGKSAPFAADALTISPYLGFDSLLPTLADAHERGRGVFVLAATSNPEAAELQTAITGDETVAASIWKHLSATNQALDGDRLGSFGAVIGATLNLDKFNISLDDAPSTPILAPGFGAQGAQLSQVSRLFRSAANRTIATVSRSVLEAGPLGIESAIQMAIYELNSGHSQGVFDE